MVQLRDLDPTTDKGKLSLILAEAQASVKCGSAAIWRNDSRNAYQLDILEVTMCVSLSLHNLRQRMHFKQRTAHAACAGSRHTAVRLQFTSPPAPFTYMDLMPPEALDVVILRDIWWHCAFSASPHIIHLFYWIPA